MPEPDQVACAGIGAFCIIREYGFEVGTVVAFISGLTKVNDPWNDLVVFFRDMTNARVKYRMIAKVLDDQDPREAAKGKPS